MILQDRRRLIQAIAGCGLFSLTDLAVAQLPSAIRRTGGSGSSRLCLAETFEYTLEHSDVIQRRVELYSDLGFGLTRFGISWMDLEKTRGQWLPPPNIRYLDICKRNGIFNKLLLGILDWPPAWFLENHKDALLRNQNGDSLPNVLSYWYPSLQELLEAGTDGVFRMLSESGAFENIKYLFVELGAAGEPLYPPSAYMKRGYTTEKTKFWFFDVYAQADFGREMESKYKGNLSAANSAWSSSFRSWSDVGIPVPGACPGGFWNDVMLWYRDTKREFIRRQIKLYIKLLSKYAKQNVPKLLVMLPGTHYDETDWRDAERTCDGDISIKLMLDNDFLVTISNETGCWLQNTGGENPTEVAYQHALMGRLGIDIPLWLETTHLLDKADQLSETVLQNRLFGFEHVDSRSLFDTDGVTPKTSNSSVRSFLARLRNEIEAR